MTKHGFERVDWRYWRRTQARVSLISLRFIILNVLIGCLEIWLRVDLAAQAGSCSSGGLVPAESVQVQLFH